MGEPKPQFEKPIEIVDYTDTDMEDLVQQEVELQEHLRVLEPNIMKTGEEVGRPYTEDLLVKVSENQGKIYLAKQDEKVMGFISVYVDKNEGEEKVSFLHVSDLNVSESYRGKGVGTTLLRRADDYAKSLGLEYLRISYRAANEDAGRLYQREGYKPYSIKLQKKVGE